jgi:hypothetical protein
MTVMTRKILPLALFFALAMSAWAQNASTGALTGVVKDPSGAVVQSAKVTVISQTTGDTRTTTTRNDGVFLIPLLPPGLYTISVSADGFKLSSVKDVAANVSETETVPINLEVGSLTETVTVSSSELLVKTESAELGRVTSTQEIESLPLVSRNYTQIIGLNPGVSAEVTNASALGRGAGSQGTGSSGFATQGGVANDNNFHMNGVEVDDLQGSGDFSGGIPVPNPDALQEFKVVTGQYDASFGRNAGAQVNVITKGGTNQLHGTLFEFLRNDDLNANDWFHNRAGQPRGVLKQNQFGGTIGGPIVKDKLFYFGSYQGTRQRNGLSSSCSSTILTPALTNDRSAPALGRLFAGKRGYYSTQLGGVGPAILPDGSNIDPAALKILQTKNPDGSYLVPTPQIVNPSQPFDTQGESLFSVPCPYTENQYMGNADYHQSAATTWSFRTFIAPSTATQTLAGGGIPGFPYLNQQNFGNYSVTHTHVFTPSLLNQAEVGFNRVVAGFTQVSPYKFSDFGINAPSFDNADPVIDIGALNGGVGIGGNGQSVNFAQNVFVAQDLVSWNRGKHNLRLGGGVTRTQDNEPGLIYPGTILTLTFADFLLGLNATDSGTAAAGLPVGNIYETLDIPGYKGRAYRALEANVYVQDDWKLTSKLTLNLGFRYERLGDISDAGGRNTGFDISKVNPNPPASGSLAGYVVPSNYNGPLPDGVVRLDNSTGIKGLGQNTWDPRVGFAWGLPRTSRVVLRGGYGLFHSRYTGQPLIQSLAAPPFALPRVLVTTTNAAASLENPFPATLPQLPSFQPYSPTTSITPFQGFAQDFRPPTFHRYSMDMQVQLGRDFLWDVGYVGSIAKNLSQQFYPNQAQLASASNPIRGVTTNTVKNVPLRVPYEGVSIAGLLLIDSLGKSWYNALVTSLSKRFSHGLQFQASYTFARDLTTEPGVASNSNGAAVAYGDQFTPSEHYGPDTFVRPHRLVVSYVYELPHPQNLQSFAGRLLGGWLVSGVATAQSGQRLFATYSNSSSVYGITKDRPNFTSGCNVGLNGSAQSRLTQYFNTSCFAAPTVVGSDNVGTTFGNAPIGNIIGPREVNVDMALVKGVAMRWPNDGAKLEFRAEAFNTLNHPQFSNPGTTFGASTFGQILSTAVTPRIMQLALKYRF